MVRIYIPATVRALRDIRLSSDQLPVPELVYAVTPALQESHSTDDLEELEYEAFLAAANASLARVAADLETDEVAPARRLVLSADAPDNAVTPASEYGISVVRIERPLTGRMLVAIHVDGDNAVTAVKAAAVALPAAESGDPEAQQVADNVRDAQLEWYDTSELSTVAALN